MKLEPTVVLTVALALVSARCGEPTTASPPAEDDVVSIDGSGSDADTAANADTGVTSDAPVAADAAPQDAAKTPDTEESVDTTPPGSGAALVITEILAKSADGGPDWIELLAVGEGTVSLSGYAMVDGGASHTPAPLPALSLTPGERLVVIAADEDPGDGSAWVPFKLGSEDSVTLLHEGQTVDSVAWMDGDAPAGTSWGRLPDETGPLQTLLPTPGAPNQALTAAPPTTPFVTDRVVSVQIELSQAAWDAILANPLAEEYQTGNIVFDGIRVDNVGVRVKGNSSLSSVVKMNTHRYSFKIDTNLYVSGQTLLGEKKLNFNNGFKDPSLIREHLGYGLARDLGLPTPRTAFVDLTVAGEHMGVYTLTEAVDGDFLDEHFDDGKGDLYKPEPPAGSLGYLGNDIAAYSGLEPEQNEDTTDHAAFLGLVAALDHGDDAALAAAIDVDMALRLLALNVALVNLDSYLGMGHNYYLYEVDGQLTMIPWDVNEAFGNFTCGCDRAGIIGLLIDEPTCGALANKPLVARLLANDAWRATYHGILADALDGPFSVANMTARIEEAAALIRPYVEQDPTLFYSVADFEKALADDVGSGVGPGGGTAIGLTAFVAERGAAVRAQLEGTSPSAKDGKGSCAGTGGPGPGPGGKCGDGVCDQAEKSNPQLCPKDCP